MTLDFITEYIEQKINKNEELVKFTYYELRVKLDLSTEETEEFVNLITIKLRNLKYKTYKAGESYTYNGTKYTVLENELIVALK